MLHSVLTGTLWNHTKAGKKTGHGHRPIKDQVQEGRTYTTGQQVTRVTLTTRTQESVMTLITTADTGSRGGDGHTSHMHLPAAAAAADAALLFHIYFILGFAAVA